MKRRPARDGGFVFKDGRDAPLLVFQEGEAAARDVDAGGVVQARRARDEVFLPDGLGPKLRPVSPTRLEPSQT